MYLDCNFPSGKLYLVMLLSVWQDCEVHAANGIAQCDESFLTCIPLYLVPSPILQSSMCVLPCKRAGSFTEQM